MGVLVLSFLTDVLDGFIARHFNQISNLGKILDPLADKVMQITVLLCLAFSNHALNWRHLQASGGDCCAGELVWQGFVFCERTMFSHFDYSIFGAVGCGGCNCSWRCHRRGQLVRVDFLCRCVFPDGFQKAKGRKESEKLKNLQKRLANEAEL